MKSKIHPLSKFKFWWDLIINSLSLTNAMYVPVEIAFNINTEGMSFLNYAMDLIFFADIILSFRTIIIDEKTFDPITSSKSIAFHYIKGGRFFIDFVATVPIEMIGDLAGFSGTTLKLISLLKLTRLLRLSRLITFIKMKKEFKQSLRLIILAVYIFLLIHLMACGTYYITDISSTWIPASEMLPQ